MADSTIQTNKSKVSGFLSQPLAPEIIAGITAPRLARSFPDALRWFPAINRAHLVMLCEQDLIAVDVAGHLLEHIGKLEAEGIEAFDLDPEREDPWFNYEAELTRRAGPEAGRLHMARSRNDLKATQDRMRARKLAEDLLVNCQALRSALIERGAEHADTIMTGYTHLQHAQPMTFGWYLLGVEAALARDTARIEDALSRLDQCPLGAGAFAGTRFPIDRTRVAELLGFARAQPHSLDAVANQDGLVELCSAATQLSMTLGRMAQDFYLWATYEFGMLEFPDSVVSTSSIMPQKKNLTVLENIKARSAVMAGALITAITACRAVPFGHSQEIGVDMGRWLWDSLDELNALLPAARVIIESASPRKARMRSLAGENFATATTLADLLSSRYGLPFRAAHHTTGRYVRLVLDGLSTEEAVKTAYKEHTGKVLDDPLPLLRDALDPAGVLKAKTGSGPSLAETEHLLEEAKERLAQLVQFIEHRSQRNLAAAQLLASATERLLSKVVRRRPA